LPTLVKTSLHSGLLLQGWQPSSKFFYKNWI